MCNLVLEYEADAMCDSRRAASKSMHISTACICIQSKSLTAKRERRQAFDARLEALDVHSERKYVYARVKQAKAAVRYSSGTPPYTIKLTGR